MSEENDHGRYRVAFDLATRIATAEGKYANSPNKEDGARAYWIELFETCLAASSSTGSVRGQAIQRANAYKK